MRSTSPASEQYQHGVIGYVGADGNVYIIDPSGENPRAVTNDAVLIGGKRLSYRQPTWSPDGSRLAFLGFAETEPGVNLITLYTVSSDGSNKVEAFSSDQFFPFYLYWTPDSQSISFLSNGVLEAGLVLHLVPGAGGASRILGVGQPFYWTWSPASDEMIIHTGGAHALNPDAELALLTASASNAALTLPLLPASFQAPDWSMDGTRIVVASEGADGGGELVLLDRAGVEQDMLALFDGIVQFSISPDSKFLAYSLEARLDQNPGGLIRDLHLIEFDRHESGLKIKQDVILGFFWSPDSQKIAYYAPVLAAPGSSKDAAPLPVALDFGLYILDINTRQISRIAVFSPTSDFLEILPFYDQYQRSVTIWSPDSNQLVFTSEDTNGDASVFVVPADGSQEAQRIASGTLAFWSWR